MNWLWFTLIGVLAGIYGGFFGLGSGTILVPTLVYMFHLTQHEAQGTVLAIMVLPVGLLAALRYYYSGNVKVSIALFLALGFLAGGFIGAHFAQRVPDILLRRIFGVVLFLLSIKMMTGR